MTSEPAKLSKMGVGHIENLATYVFEVYIYKYANGYLQICIHHTESLMFSSHPRLIGRKGLDGRALLLSIGPQKAAVAYFFCLLSFFIYVHKFSVIITTLQYKPK